MIWTHKNMKSSNEEVSTKVMKIQIESNEEVGEGLECKNCGGVGHTPSSLNFCLVCAEKEHNRRNSEVPKAK